MATVETDRLVSGNSPLGSGLERHQAEFLSANERLGSYSQIDESEECIPMNPCANDGLAVAGWDNVNDVLAV